MPAQHIQPFAKPSKPKELYLPCGTLLTPSQVKLDRKGLPQKVR
jgi:hypothetical protein